MISYGINVCLGSDGSSAGDSQSLFPVMKFVAALSELNGIGALDEYVENTALRMATVNGHRLWEDIDFTGDFIEFSPSLGPYGYVWDEPVTKIKEVYINGTPRLASARRIVEEQRADQVVFELMLNMLEPECERRSKALTEWDENQIRGE